MIKAIFFDFDGVLTTDVSGGDTICTNIANIAGIPYQAVRNAYAPFVPDLAMGRKTMAEIWDTFCDAFGTHLDISILNDVYTDIPINTAMFDIAKLCHSTYYLGVITDNLKDRLDALVKHHRLATIFDAFVCSAELGTGKHTQEIFLSALRQSGFQAQESIFIDNKEKNLVAANNMGFHTYFHNAEKNDVNAFAEWLREQGVEV